MDNFLRGLQGLHPGSTTKRDSAWSVEEADLLFSFILSFPPPEGAFVLLHWLLIRDQSSGVR